jgi:sulfoxide reductase heme-binding subunit YedZ
MTKMRKFKRKHLVRAIAIGLGLLPVSVLVTRFFLGDGLGANPVEEITHVTGEFGLRFLIVSLAVTPLRRFLGWNWLAPERRTFGLFAFFYATLHFTTYLALDLNFEFSLLAEDIIERPYITVGFAALMAMLPLALTSTKSAIQRLGRRWVTLHRLSYAAALLGALHFFWLVKADLVPPAIHAGVIALLLASRALPARRPN